MTCWKLSLPNHHQARYLLCCKLDESIYECSTSSTLSCHTSNYTISSWHSHTWFIFSNYNPLTITTYSYNDLSGCLDTRHSTTGWCMFLGNALISWKCKKLERISKSSTKAECRAMSSTCFEILWLCGALPDLGFAQNPPTPFNADNTSAIQIAEYPVFHERTKHIEVDCNFNCDE